MARRSPLASRPPRGRGFTLVELLVVIVIIGILVAILVPAVQYAREAARRNDCMSHLGQLAKGALQHESDMHYYPTGGWGWSNLGDPDRGYGDTQPGGWFYCILPFIDQQPLHDLGVNIPYTVGGSDANTQQRVQLALQMIETPVTIANCPSRRRPAVQQAVYGYYNYGGNFMPSGKGQARTDYAACSASVTTTPQGIGSQIDGGPADPGFGNNTVPYSAQVINALYAAYSGVVFRCSEVSTAQIHGGTNNLILLGDKYDCATKYYNGQSGADNECQYVGFDNDTSRDTYNAPMRDTDQTDSNDLFGSAHYSACNFAFCDGSVRPLSYNIDLLTFRQLGERVKVDASGNPAVIDESKIK